MQTANDEYNYSQFAEFKLSVSDIQIFQAHASSKSGLTLVTGTTS